MQISIYEKWLKESEALGIYSPHCHWYLRPLGAGMINGTISTSTSTSIFMSISISIFISMAIAHPICPKVPILWRRLLFLDSLGFFFFFCSASVKTFQLLNCHSVSKYHSKIYLSFVAVNYKYKICLWRNINTKELCVMDIVLNFCRFIYCSG